MTDKVTDTTPEAFRNFRTQLQTTTRKLLTPPQKLLLSEWADQNVVLGLASPEPGPWRTSRAPYQKEILDVCGDYHTQRVALMTSAQVGKTATLLNIATYYMQNDPAPIMVVQPDKSMADSFSSTKLEPILTESPSLRALVASKRKRDGGNRKLEKVFPGGFITMVSSKSAHSLRSRSIRILLLDEIDAYENEIVDEGDPVKLAEVRTVTFPNRKIILCSTPTVLGFSRIEREFLQSDQRYFHVPCPHCKEFQRLQWGGTEYHYGIKWNNTYDHVWYECEHCHAKIEESSKLQMMLQGKWVVTNPTGKFPGFQISSLYSPWSTWSYLMQAWFDVAQLPDKRQSFFNLRLGEPYEDTTNKIDPTELSDRMSSYDATCPTGVGVIVCGVDVQHSWLEVSVYGFGVGEQMWNLETAQFVGETSEQAVWEELEAFLRTKYRTAKNAPIPIAVTGIDAGDQTELVNRHCADLKAKGLNVVPTKGFDGARSAFEWSRYKKSGIPRLGIVGVSQIKGILYSRLKNVKAVGDGYIHFPANTHPEVFNQILAERKVTIHGKGSAPKIIWKKLRERNEQLDCMIYAYAVFHSLGSTILRDIGGLVAKVDEMTGSPDDPNVLTGNPSTLAKVTPRFANARKKQSLVNRNWMKKNNF